MGEYEPDDSRDVTLTDGHAPGEPPRTGPREDDARRKAQHDAGKDAEDKDRQPPAPARKGIAMQQPQQKVAQSQSQSQTSSEGKDTTDEPAPGSREAGVAQAAREANIDEGDPGHPANRRVPGYGEPDSELNADIEDGPLAGDQPQAIDNVPGGARPEYDQYEVNSPENMHQDRKRDDRQREQAGRQNDSSLSKGLGMPRAEQEAAEARGYGTQGDERSESGG